LCFKFLHPFFGEKRQGPLNPKNASDSAGNWASIPLNRLIWRELRDFGCAFPYVFFPFVKIGLSNSFEYRRKYYTCYPFWSDCFNAFGFNCLDGQVFGPHLDFRMLQGKLAEISNGNAGNLVFAKFSFVWPTGMPTL
jgi:hypothetical protein